MLDESFRHDHSFDSSMSTVAGSTVVWFPLQEWYSLVCFEHRVSSLVLYILLPLTIGYHTAGRNEGIIVVSLVEVLVSQ